MDETFRRVIGDYYDSSDDHIFDRDTFILACWLSNVFGMFTEHKESLKNLYKNIERK